MSPTKLAGCLAREVGSRCWHDKRERGDIDKKQVGRIAHPESRSNGAEHYQSQAAQGEQTEKKETSSEQTRR
ncbi:hypothetical protein [Streptomyces sp. 7N604]|uniref:hypothetical protein n=1 Tax=Streptomyces sp. 7N604 TaxID=3457415 RepID=UPI003FD6A67F